MLLTSILTRRLFLAPFFLTFAFGGAPCILAQTDSPANASAESQTSVAGQSVSIRWRARPNVNRYRLQLALDNNFNDIVLDRAVFANTYQITELPPGRYYWRIAPATIETERFTTVGVVTIAQAETVSAETAQAETVAPQSQPTPPLTVAPAGRNEAVLSPPLNTGWSTAIGETLSIAVGRFSPTVPPVILALNSEGIIYSVDAQRGVAQWTSRFNPALKNGEKVDRAQIGEFTPLVMQSGVIVAFNEGVRLIDVTSGREVWRVSIGGQPIAGLIAGTNAGNSPEAIIVTRNPDKLYVINNRSGRIEREQTLDGTVVGAPLALQSSAGAEFLLALDNGRLAIFNNRERDAARSVKLDTRITTAPLLAESASGTRLLVGTERGLVALQLPDLQPVWRIATEGEPPRGMLASADLDGDRNTEAVMITRTGRIAAVDVERGVIKWVVEGGMDTAGAVFADVNGDGTLDVLVAGKTAFADGYSGRDGKLVWSTEDGASSGMAARQNDSAGAIQTTVLRSLIVTPVRDESGIVNGVMLVGADPARVGLRGVRLSRNAIIEVAR